MPDTHSPPGEILESAIYSIKEFCRRLQIGDAGFRALRAEGLKVIRIGKRGFVRGRDFATFAEAADKSNR